MAKPILMQAHCNTCGGSRHHHVLFERQQPWQDDQYSIHGANEYYVLECAGCQEIRLLHTHWFSEETDPDGNPILNENYYPPAIARPVPDWVTLLDREWHVTKLLHEIYSALQNNQPALAAMGLRAVIEAIMISRTGDNGSFKENLKRFEGEGFISRIQNEALTAALEVGHASIHRGHIPSEFELQTALEVTENLLHLIEVLGDQAKRSISKLPSRKG